MQRRRVNISVDPELYGRMESAARRFGFRNLCRFAVSCIRAALDTADRRRRERGRDTADTRPDSEYIAGMFREYSEEGEDRKGIRAKTGTYMKDQ